VWAGIIIFGPFVAIIKHVRIQLIVMMAILVAFMGGYRAAYCKTHNPVLTAGAGALASCNSSNFGQSAAFSFLAAFPAGILEVMAGLLVQMDSNDADLGMVFCSFPVQELSLRPTNTCGSHRLPFQTGLGNNLYVGFCVSAAEFVCTITAEL
jgi:hypothetical protein